MNLQEFLKSNCDPLALDLQKHLRAQVFSLGITAQAPDNVPGVRVIRVNGFIGQGFGFEADINQISSDIDAAVADPLVSTIAFIFNSAGGVAGGVPELAQKIRDIAKPKYAFASGLAASAAYWLAAAADQVFTTRTAEVGSVGVYLAILDETQALANAGVKVELFTSGALKGIGHIGVAITDDQRAFLQARVDSLAAMFKADVQRFRGGIPEQVLQGQTLLGADAVTANLADGLLTDEAAFLKLISSPI